MSVDDGRIAGFESVDELLQVSRLELARDPCPFSFARCNLESPNSPSRDCDFSLARDLYQ